MVNAHETVTSTGLDNSPMMMHGQSRHAGRGPDQGPGGYPAMLSRMYSF